MAQAALTDTSEGLAFCLPDIGEGIAEGEILAWLVSPGQHVTEDEPLLEVMTDKVTVEIPSPFTGQVLACLGAVGEIAQVGKPIVRYLPVGAAPLTSPTAEPKITPRELDCPLQVSPPPLTPEPTPLQADQRLAQRNVLAAPATRKLAQRLGISLVSVTGTGPHGRVTPDDVEATRGQQQIRSSAPANAPPKPKSLPQLPPTVLPYTGLRRTIGQRLSHAKQTIPEFVVIEDCNVTALVGLRSRLKPWFEAKHGLKLTYLPFVLQALCQSLQAYPQLNASLVNEQEIHQHASLNLGLAVDVPDGLLVPVLHNAQTLSLVELAQQAHHLANLARLGQCSKAHLSGGTFTVTSIGGLGGVVGLPIINAPEAAILAVNRIRRTPVIDEATGNVVAGEMMALTLTCDHRLVDGALAARFITHLRQQLEAPEVLLLA
jgi:pyruvate/2-oxoglutarate dehydrogenase complex dihydrolipoamide acyltransferase (E2) component